MPIDKKDPKYGIPQLKKFPLPDARHVRSAIRFFNYAPPRYERQLAAAILRRMKEYGLSFDDFTVGEENRFHKYIPKKQLDQAMAHSICIDNYGRLVYSDELWHHGILGQEWGVQNGPPYPLSDSAHSAKEKESNWKVSVSVHRVKQTAKTKHKVDEIIDSMSPDDRDKVLAGCDRYLDLEEGEHVAKRALKEIDGVPVSFFDILEDSEDTFVLSLGTRSGEQYRGKGYASEVADQAMTWLEKNKKRLPQKKIVWGVRVDNIGSIKIAEKHGFELDKDSYSDDGKWVNYVRKLK